MDTEFFEMMSRGNWVVLDTETTGLDRPAEICQIAIVSAAGHTEFDMLVKPTWHIPVAATAIHGITDEMVRDAPTWPMVRPVLLDALRGKDVIVYNAIFDRKLMHWSDEESDGAKTDYKAESTWWCAMEMYARVHGERHPYYGTYVWQKLAVAIAQQGIEHTDFHQALDDCLATWKLIQKLYRVELDFRSKS